MSELELQLSNSISGGYHLEKDYKQIKKEINILKQDLKGLRHFQNRVLKKEVKGYGFIH